ncbi:MAG: hypothetical protein ACP5DZ_05575 [Bacteroidales bacterium]
MTKKSDKDINKHIDNELKKKEIEKNMVRILGAILTSRRISKVNG